MTTAITEGPALSYVQPQRPSAAAARPSRKHLWALLAITILGGLLRFSFPARPPLWGDDAYTIYRTHADYQSMLDILQYDGFTPLHYELYWLLGRATGTEYSSITHDPHAKVVHATHLTPRVIRFLPALFGTIMVPAMYFLAVQLVRRKTALAAALLTACSAYLLGYSRDMKMYMMVWCFSALSAGCLFWWFRTHRRIAWLSWVAASLAMASSHMTGMALLPLEAIFFMTRSNVRWKQSILFVIGLAITIAPPAGYILKFNTWAQEKVEDFGFEVEGLGWVVYYNAGRTGPELLRYAASAYLFSWEWPKPMEALDRAAAEGLTVRPRDDPSTEKGIPQWIQTTLKSGTVLFLILAAIGAMPWSRRLRGIAPDEALPQPWWRVFLWIGLWLIVPVYFMYCRSVNDFASPKIWTSELSSLLAGGAWQNADGSPRGIFWLVLAGAAALSAAGIALLPRLRRGLLLAGPIVAGALLIVSALRTGIPSTNPKGTQWIEVILQPFVACASWLSEPIVFTCLALILPGLMLYYCGADWRRRAGRAAQFVLVFATLLGCCWLVYFIAQQKYHKELVEFLGKGSGGKAHTLADFTPSQIERAKIALARPGGAWQSIFMPRYVGFVWIAFCIGLCALLMRLPTRAFRAAAIGLLVAFNLAQFSARLFAGTEPPLDRVAGEVWADDSHNPRADPTTRVYVNDTAPGGPGHPGFGTLVGQQGKYYLGLARGYWIAPKEWKTSVSSTYFDIGSGRGRGRSSAAAPGAIAAEARRSPGITRIIVWDKFFDEETLPKEDRLEALLGSQWKQVGKEDYRVRFHWNWKDLYVYRRTEYVKADRKAQPKAALPAP